MFSSDLCKENEYCKTVYLYACGLLLLLKTILEYILRILIFTDLFLPRNSAKIGGRENFPFFGKKSLTNRLIVSNVKNMVSNLKKEEAINPLQLLIF